MFNYANIKTIAQQNSHEKIKNVIYGSWYGNTFKIILCTIFLIEILITIIPQKQTYLFLFLYITILSLSIIYVITRKSSLALTENNIICLIFHHIRNTPKEKYEIPKSKLKSLSVHQFLYMRFIKLSFIDKTGRLKNKKLYFSSFLLGKNKADYKNNIDIIYRELKEQQHIMEKGDF